MMLAVMRLAWPALRLVGLQGLTGLWALVLTPAGRAVVIGALAIGGYIIWEARTLERGAAVERAANAALTRQAEAAAQTEHDAIQGERDAAAARDETELAALAAQDKGARDAETNGYRVLWRADDGWLRNKTAAAAARRH